MSTDGPQSVQQPQDEPLYEFSIYPFSTDLAFQEGLQSIVSSAHGKSPEELETIIGQAKTFYFARMTGHKVTWDNYLEWRKTHTCLFPDAPTAAAGADVETSMTTTTEPEDRGHTGQLTFQQITDLINTGQTHLIPNNKVIPEALHEESPSESTNAVRKKPWETAER